MHFYFIPSIREGEIKYKNVISLYLLESGDPIDFSWFVT
ncbi:hypothetical protein M090_3626 [Parabacteroides distasonis str. 3776 Po2 i]|uniref:Uncharacterized protein n=1 Tax=Parabacteroides distasonis str. 3776 D15 i TaxID=1339342 RepID=A0AB34LGS6_PARDI|nr:hypothetical protein M091_4805 [Parabacteroides distasonis str. 3776 D15 i]KDS46969.1 hypothetical protein M090_3626 [Parabacteroides distasonis str. 3776 Po2 i]